jgi:very-short-patch-repair endonuclease
MKNKIAEKLETSRQELLDIGLRGNTLLHFKPRAHSLTIFDEVSIEIFKILVENQRTMSFLPLPKVLLKEDEKEEFSTDLFPELLEEKLGSKRHTDNKLQTKLNQDQLDKKLLKINTEAETYYKEQGIDILYLALGFLSWYDSEVSDIERKAPLILIPVSLNRLTAQERFKLKYTQVDLGTNLTLKAKLKSDFTIELPEFNEDVTVAEYFKKINKEINKHSRWKIIEDEIHLGFFKFGKFQMYQDLDAKVWPKDKQPSEHPIIKSLFGSGFFNFNEDKEDEIIEKEFSNSLQNLENLHFIADADSSQTEAILKIKKGENLVIQGPPGTGKSQTITNIIAESLADNKKILFVSEKMVALEVVKRRLDNCHLGDTVLELHSHKSNKKTVLNELGRTLDLGEPKVDNRENQVLRYKELQKRLDNYSDAVKKSILSSEINFVEAVGYLSYFKSLIDKCELKPIQIDSLETWSKTKFNNSIILIKDLIEDIENNGLASKNYFSKSTLDYFSPADKTFVDQKLIEIINEILIVKKDTDSIIQEIPIKATITLTEIKKLISLVNHLKSKPNLNSINIPSKLWSAQQNEVKKIINEGKEFKNTYTQYSELCIDAAFSFDVIQLRQTYVTKANKWWRFLSSEYRSAKNTLKGLLKSELPSTIICIEIIEAILNYQKLEKSIKNNKEIAITLFGDKWKGVNSDWQELEDIIKWLSELYSKINNDEVSNEIPNLLDKVKDEIVLNNIESNFENLNSKIEALYQKIQIEENSKNATYSKNIDFDLLENQMKNMQDNLHQIFQISRFNLIKKKLNSNDLSIIAGLGYNWSYEPKHLLDLFKYSYYNSLVNDAYKERDSIKFFDSVGHAKDIIEFKRLDAKLSQFSQERLMLNHFQNLPSVYAPGEMALIRRETNKKKRHIPIRQLLLKAGNAIQQIKPVFMMSPMSVATFLSQGNLEFDLVIFDEASQVKVVDALIPILRGKQIVVVGDSKQMPPTDFFSKTFENEENEDVNVTGDIESILGMFLAQGVKESMLKWHYRSRHDSLINVSNQEFYDGRLMVFPSSGTNEKATGLRFNHIPESIYEKGTSRTNPYEAKKVAEAVMKHAESNPELTLGVVAFSTAQRDCIILELERLRRLDSSLEAFFSKENLEEFFVKNLENVQGDERDIIFISIGYGRTAHRKVTNSFGPINREGGERRLNVLITRARLGMEVFCNFTADDIETKSTTPFGVKALKSFLKYAETGEIENRHETGKETDSPFEDEVIKAITDLGYNVEPQVGSAGFFIDIAVIDPIKSGKYILAVECDGASYHSSATARDRDRLRQNVLENMGWKFHRIWSTDWFRTPKKQIEKLKVAIENAVIDSESKTTVEVSEVKRINHEISREDVEHLKPIQKKYQVINTITDLSYYILETSNDQLANHIQEVVTYEGALHLKEVAKRITELVGISRVGNRIYAKMLLAAKFGHKNNLFYLGKEYLYKDATKTVEVRDRSDLPSKLKDIEYVPLEEVQKAIIKTIELAFSIPESDVISEALSLMGFKKATEKASAIIKKEVINLLKMNIIKREGDKLLKI